MKISALFANKRTRVIVIVAAVVLVLAILTPILLYASGYIMPVDANGQLSERLLNTVKRDYALYRGVSTQDVSIMYDCGYYNGCVPVMLTDIYTGVYPAVTHDQIDGVRFSYGDSRQLTVWRYGRFYMLSEAYENRWLSRDDLLSIREAYLEQR